MKKNADTKIDVVSSASPKNAVSALSRESERDEMLKEFETELYKPGKAGWIFFVNILMMVPGICIMSLHTSFLKIDTSNNVRCKIYELENSNWPFFEIQNISQPMTLNSDNCYYYNYPYSNITDMTFQEAKSYLANMSLPKLLPCHDVVILNNSVSSPAHEFNLTCSRSIVAITIDIGTDIGEFLSYCFIAPFGDILGRRRVINWGMNFFFIAVIVTGLATTTYALFIGKMLAGMAYAMQLICMQALVIELFDQHFRPFKFVLLRSGIGLVYIIMPLVAYKHVKNWRHLYWLTAIPVLFLPLLAWYIFRWYSAQMLYVPESPRWYLSKRKKGMAWAVLRSLKDAPTQNEILLLFKNENINYTEFIKDHFREFRKMILKFFLITFLLFLTGCVYFHNFSLKCSVQSSVARATYMELAAIAFIFGFLLCLTLILSLGRKLTLIILYLLSAVAYLCGGFSHESSRKSIISLLAIEIATNAVFSTALLYTTELVPTSHRCTATGLANAFGHIFGTIIFLHIFNYVEMHAFCYTLAVISLLGSFISFFIRGLPADGAYDNIDDTARPHSS